MRRSSLFWCIIWWNTMKTWSKFRLLKRSLQKRRAKEVWLRFSTQMRRKQITSGFCSQRISLMMMKSTFQTWCSFKFTKVLKTTSSTTRRRRAPSLWIAKYLSTKFMMTLLHNTQDSNRLLLSSRLRRAKSLTTKWMWFRTLWDSKIASKIELKLTICSNLRSRSF